MTDQSLQTRLREHLHELPILPAVVIRLLQLDGEDERYADMVIETIETEPNFATRVLAAANSASSSPASPIKTIAAAITRIGASPAVNLVVSTGVTKVFVPRDAWDKSLWRHALQVASAARAISLHTIGTKVHPEEAYLAGLLHDVGRFVMFQEAPELLRRIDDGTWDSPEELTEMEATICGLNHAELGAIACHQWSIPDPVLQVVLHHHDRKIQNQPGMTSIVQFADLAMFPSARPDTPEYGETERETVLKELHLKLPPNVNLNQTQLNDLITTVTDDAESLSRAIGLD